MCQLPPLSQPASRSQALDEAEAEPALTANGIAARKGAVARPMVRVWLRAWRWRPRVGVPDRFCARCAMGVPLAACEVSCRVQAREMPGRGLRLHPKDVATGAVTQSEVGPPLLPSLFRRASRRWAGLGGAVGGTAPRAVGTR